MANFGASGGSFGGSSAGSMFLRLTLDDAGYKSKLASAQSQTVSATAKMGTSFTQLQGVAKRAIGALGAVEVLRRSIAAYDEQVKAVARLNIAFSNSPSLIGASTDAFIEQAAALSKLTGIQDENIIGAQAALSVFGLTEDQLRRLTPLVLDFAAFTGQDATAAATALGRAVLGNARALKTIGIDFQRTGNLAADFETVMSLVGDRVGGTAEAIATPMDKLKVAVDEAFEAIGGFLAPAMEGLSTILGALPPALTAVGIGLGILAVQGKQAALTFSKWLGPILAVTEGLAFLGDVVKEDVSWLDALGNSADRLSNLLMLPKDLSDPIVEFIMNAPGAQEAFAEMAAEAEGYADATAEATAETLGLISAQYQLAGGMLGLVESFRSANDSERDLAEARKELSDLTKDGKKGTAEYAEAQRAVKDAQLDSLGAQLALEEAVVGYMDALNEGGSSREAAIADIRAMGARAGLTKKEVDTLIERILAIPDNSYTNIQINNEAALTKIAETINSLAAIPAYKTVSISVVTSGAAQYGGQLALEQGGIYKGAAGLITRGPIMRTPNVMLGEGRSYTPWGPGTEAAIPLNTEGRRIIAEAFSMALRENGGGAATINVNGYQGDPERLADSVSRRLARGY